MKLEKKEQFDSMDNEITFQIKQSVQGLRKFANESQEKENHSDNNSKLTHSDPIKADIKSLIADYKKDKK